MKMDNDFINDFIEEYKNQPCLWQASSADFKDRKKRQEAYYKLIEVASKHGEHYNIERTKQKINNLRCAFRHQLKKFTESKNNKTGKDEGYCPKRRYIESLMFLLNEEQQENAKVDNLKMTPVTKKKANGISKNLNNSGSENSKKDLIKNEKQPIYCEAIVIPGDTTSNMGDDIESNKEQNQHLQQQQSQDVIVKTIDEGTTESVPKDSMQQQDSVHIEVHCDDDVNLIWPRSNIPTHKSNETNSVPIPITSSTPVKISTVPVSVPVATVTIIPATIPTSVPTITTVATMAIDSNNTNSNNSSSNNNNNYNSNYNNSNNNILNTNLTNSSTIRQRTLSTSSQNSSHSITENAPKKVKIDCSATNFEKLLSLACSKINSINDADDDFAIFGKMVSYKLRSMDSQQAIIAEKLITDILLEGQMKMLTYPLRTATTAAISSFRQDDGKAFVINLNGNPTDHHTQSDSSKYSHSIQYTTTTGSGS